MADDGETFAPDAIGWIDFETKSPIDIDNGTYRYMTKADAIVLAYAIGSEPARTVTATAKHGVLRWDDTPRELRDHHYKVTAGEAIWAAYNAGFDRAAWNYATVGFPVMEPHHIIDVMAQAMAAGLPAGLGDACKHAGTTRKVPEGKKLVELFCLGDATSQSHPMEWGEFLEYAIGDVEAMRDLFRHTLQLSLGEWQEYWAAETINERGIGVDIALATAASKMAAIDSAHIGNELEVLTCGAVTKVTQVQRMISWLRERLDEPCVKLMTRTEEEVDIDTGELVKPRRDSLSRARLQQLIVRLEDREDPLSAEEAAALRVLQLRLYGGSTTPAKFGRILQSNVDGVLMGQYVFNGAPQTGRFSSRGVQIHNLMRDALPYEMDALDALTGGCSYEAFRFLGDASPVSRKLSMLVRPVLVPTRGEVFVWGDWSQIEARVLPWLADSPEAEARLDIFRQVDADPSLPDLYIRSVASMMGMGTDEITPELRQRGKVAELACGFGGGRGALQNMAAAYNMALSDEQAQEIVGQWRKANPWAVAFWGRHEQVVVDGKVDLISTGLWGAANRALEEPGAFHTAGRVGYIYKHDYLGGALLCLLPSGRFLTYRGAKWERLEEEDAHGNVNASWQLTFRRGYGRIKMWPGFLAENVTQAVAADVLRGTLVRLVDDYGFDVRAHTHDEVLVQCPEADASALAGILIGVMEEGFDWSAGLPLKAEPVIGRWYSKSKGSHGL